MKFHLTAGCFMLLLAFWLTTACNSDRNNENEESPLTTAFNEATVTYKSGNNVFCGSENIMIGDKISAQREIRTGNNSSLVLQLDDSSVIRLMPDSSVRINTLTAVSRELILEQGRVLVKVAKLEEDQSFEIKAGGITAAVRGTSFRVMKTDDSTTVTVTEGKIAVLTPEKNDIANAIITEPGFTVQADQGDTERGLILRRSTTMESAETRKIDAVPILKDFSDAIKIESTGRAINGADTRIDEEINGQTSIEEKRRAVISHRSVSLDKLKDTFNRIDEVTLYNKRVISGIIISRGMNYEMITPEGHVIFPEKDIRNIRILK